MPKGQAGRLIARDLRQNKEKRRKRIKTKANLHQNQHEYLRMSTRKRQKRQTNDADLLLADEQYSDPELSEEEEPTQTHNYYQTIMKDPAFLLTMQPKMYEDADGVDSEEDQENQEQKIGASDKELSMLLES